MNTVPREQLIRALPYARRYARALTGNQAGGDELVGAALKTLSGPDFAEEDPRLPLYRAVSRQFDARAPSSTARSSKGPLSDQQRQLLLLVSLEELSLEQAASALGLDPERAAEILADARAELKAATATDVLIIEDEPIIAMDIEELVQDCGHRVVGVATSEREAVDMARRARPGLILADINLGVGGDGMRAVARIMQSSDAPVIFVTAYPERLLTGEAIEPAFVITKPFEPMTLAITTYQAITGGVDIG